MKRMMFIINPAAGRSIMRDNLMGIVRIFSDRGYIVSIYMTRKNGDATNFVVDYGELHDLIVCAGGDGTLNEVVNGVLRLKSDIAIGYIPAGTTNDFAVSHDLSRFPLQAAHDIVRTKPRPHDIGRFNNQHFCYVAACGLFTDVSFSTPQALKNVFGRLAYYFEGAKKIPELNQEFSLFISIDGRHYSGKYCFFAVTNSLSLGGLLQFSENEVSMSDGVLEILAIRSPQSPLDIQKLIKSVKDKDYNNDIIRCFHGKHIKIKSEVPINWTLDGEEGGSIIEATISVEHRKIQFIY